MKPIYRINNDHGGVFSGTSTSESKLDDHEGRRPKRAVVPLELILPREPHRTNGMHSTYRTIEPMVTIVPEEPKEPIEP